MSHRIKNNSQHVVIFNITDESIMCIPDIIKSCFTYKRQLKVYSSLGDDTNLELCQISEVKNLYQIVCQKYRL